LQQNIDNSKNETWIGLFSTANGGCRLRFTINKFSFELSKWTYGRIDENFPILNTLENNAASDDLQSPIGIFSFLRFMTQPELKFHFYVYFYSNSSLVTNST
jgi:hypothetical protein